MDAESLTYDAALVTEAQSSANFIRDNGINSYTQADDEAIYITSQFKSVEENCSAAVSNW